jgi:hypothetical protein
VARKEGTKRAIIWVAVTGAVAVAVAAARVVAMAVANVVGTFRFPSFQTRKD